MALSRAGSRTLLLALFLLAASRGLPAVVGRAIEEHSTADAAAAATTNKAHKQSHIEVMLGAFASSGGLTHQPKPADAATAATSTSSSNVEHRATNMRKLAPTFGPLTNSAYARLVDTAATLSRPGPADDSSSASAPHHTRPQDGQTEQQELPAPGHSTAGAAVEAVMQHPSASAGASPSQHRHEQQLNATAVAGSDAVVASGVAAAREPGTAVSGRDEDALIARVLGDASLRAALLAKLGTAQGAAATGAGGDAAPTDDEPLPAPAKSSTGVAKSGNEIAAADDAVDEPIRATTADESPEPIAESPSPQPLHLASLSEGSDLRKQDGRMVEGGEEDAPLPLPGDYGTKSPLPHHVEAEARTVAASESSVTTSDEGSNPQPGSLLGATEEEHEGGGVTLPPKVAPEFERLEQKRLQQQQREQQKQQVGAESPAPQPRSGAHVPASAADDQKERQQPEEEQQAAYEKRHQVDEERYQQQVDKDEEDRPMAPLRDQEEPTTAKPAPVSEDETDETLEALPAPAQAKGIAIQENPRDRPPVREEDSANVGVSRAPLADADAPASASTAAFLSGNSAAVAAPQPTRRRPTPSPTVRAVAGRHPADRQRDLIRTAASSGGRSNSAAHLASHIRTAAAESSSSSSLSRRHRPSESSSAASAVAWHATGHLAVAFGAPSPARALSSQAAAAQPMSPQQRLSGYDPRAGQAPLEVSTDALDRAWVQDAQRGDAVDDSDGAASSSPADTPRTAAAAAASALRSAALRAAALCCVCLVAFVVFAVVEDVLSVPQLGRGGHVSLPARVWFVTVRLLRRCWRAYGAALRKARCSAGASPSFLPSHKGDRYPLLAFARAFWHGLFEGGHISWETATQAARRLSAGTTSSESDDCGASPHVPSRTSALQQQPEYVRKRFTADAAGVGAVSSDGVRFYYGQHLQQQKQHWNAAGSGTWVQGTPASPAPLTGHRSLARSGSAGSDAAVWVSLGGQAGRY